MITSNPDSHMLNYIMSVVGAALLFSSGITGFFRNQRLSTLMLGTGLFLTAVTLRYFVML